MLNDLRYTARMLRKSPLCPSLFRTAGLAPVLGRSFTDDDDRPRAPKVAMISEGLWKQRFGGDAAAIGHVITLSGVDVTIVGIALQTLQLLPTFRSAATRRPEGLHYTGADTL